ncbi:MAG TPA: MFS transporter [Alphaproteobacteria bacterium]|nr:MFS transporter [Alphaproteobacteria bacterium]
MKKTKSSRIITAAMIGNSLEYYDWSLFVFLAPVMSPLFFPSEDKIVSILLGLGTFAIGFIMRPIGAIIFGYIGDIYGRKRALTLSILLMAIPTFCIGLLPTYETIGAFAPLALILLRLLQGLCTGGEYNGAGILVVENVEPSKAGFAGGMITSSSAIGSLLGSAVASLCTLELLPTWSWRVAFLFGIVVGFIGFYIRQRITDAYMTEILNQKKTVYNFPLLEVIKKNPSAILCVIGIAAFSGIMSTISMKYVNVFLTTFQKWSSSEALIVTSFGILSYIILAPFSGWMSDKFGGKVVMGTGAIVTLLGIYPFLSLLTSESTFFVVSAQFSLVILAAWFQGPMNLFMADLFSPETRYSGLAFSYCTGMAIFGGTTPMIATFLVDWTGSPVTPAFYIILGAAAGLVSVIYAKSRTRFGRYDFSQEVAARGVPSSSPA